MIDNFDLLIKVAQGRRKKFPQGNEPAKIISRLCEETGELAQAVNRFEGISSKPGNRDEDKNEIAKESIDTMQNIIAILTHACHPKRN